MAGLRPRQRAPYHRRIQMIHQDPYSALNPTRTIGQILADPLALRAKQVGADPGWLERRRAELLGLVGLDPDYVLPRYPHMLSGGMRQRVVIARALTVDPDVLVADEAVSMIDVSLRLGILQLLRDLRDAVGVSLLFITHDIATARYVGHGGQLCVIYRGAVVEQGDTDTVIQHPAHPYTQCLLSAIPVMRGIELPGPERVVPTGPLDERSEPPGLPVRAEVPVRRGGLPGRAARAGPARRHAAVARVPSSGPAVRGRRARPARRAVTADVSSAWLGPAGRYLFGVARTVGRCRLREPHGAGHRRLAQHPHRAVRKRGADGRGGRGAEPFVFIRPPASTTGALAASSCPATCAARPASASAACRTSPATSGSEQARIAAACLAQLPGSGLR